MTNLFPQQRFFAIIIFISFCLHSALFYSGTIRQAEQSRINKSERILEQLSNEFSFPLVYKDRVGLSVIANSYAKQYKINRIVIRNAKDEILVQTGIDPMLGGEKYKTDINVNTRTIGHIEITLKSASNGDIFKFLWYFIITSLMIHLGVWFLYLNFSTPSEEDLQKVCDEISHNKATEKNNEKDEELVEKNSEIIVDRPRKQAPKKVLMELADYIIEHKQNPQQQKQVKAEVAIVDKASTEEAQTESNQQPEVNLKIDNEEKITITPQPNINGQDVNEEENFNIRIDEDTEDKASEDVNTSNKILGATKGKAGTTNKRSILFPQNPTKPKQPSTEKIKKPASNIVQVKKSTLIKKRHDKPSLLTEQPSFTKLAIEFQYVDKYHLLEKVMPVIAKNYFDLSSQLLQMAITELLADERLLGVTLVNKPVFTAKGAKVKLQTTTNDQKQLLLASTMLANLYQMINQVVYDTRRKEKNFAFNMNIGISYIEQNSVLKGLTEFNKNENVIIGLQYSALKLIKNKVSIHKNRQEKYHYLDNMNRDLLSTLVDIRNYILEME
ncbi:MAG: hypothetical protein KGV51_01740 [Moraxellaceae bacterium]|nr:hypothetical protein [Moraxellaceae bacterium]